MHRVQVSVDIVIHFFLNELEVKTITTHDEGKTLKFLPKLHSGPVKPGVHLHCPVTRSQASPCVQPHGCLHCFP